MSKIVHGALDVAGFIPGLGAVPDLLNAGLYLAEGDKSNAALSAVAAVPLAGDAVKGTSMAVKGGSAAMDLGRAAKGADAIGGAGSLSRNAGTVSPTTARGVDGATDTAQGTSGKRPRDQNGADGSASAAKRTKADDSATGSGSNLQRFSSIEGFNQAANGPAAGRANQVLEFGTYKWTTDSLGRVTKAEGKVDLTPHGRKTNGVTTTEIGKEGKQGDIGFHLIGDQFNGPINRVNVVPGNGVRGQGADGKSAPNLNQGAYAKHFETPVKELAKDPAKNVEMKVEPVYRDSSTRPQEFLASYRVDNGAWVENTFANRPGGK